MEEISKNDKLCLIFNLAPHYRESIFKLINESFSCDWYFGENSTNIREMETSKLSNVHFLKNTNLIGKSIFYRRGLSSLISNSKYQTFLMTGETHNVAVWLFLLKHKFFYKNKQVYLWAHGWYGKESFFEKVLKKFFFRLSEGVFLYGEYAKELMIKEGFDSSKMHVIHNSLQFEQHFELYKTLKPSVILKEHFNNDNKNIIFIGRLTVVKKLDLLIEAVDLLNQRGLNLNLTFVGGGTETEKLQSLVVRKRLDKQVWFYGASYDDRVNAELIYNADVCVSPGNVGLTAIHTMTFGTPVITHNNFPMQMPEFETIERGITGDYFEYDNVVSLADTIQKWFVEHKDRESVRQLCHEKIATQWTPIFQLDVLKKNLVFS